MQSNVVQNSTTIASDAMLDNTVGGLNVGEFISGAAEVIEGVGETATTEGFGAVVGVPQVELGSVEIAKSFKD